MPLLFSFGWFSLLVLFLAVRSFRRPLNRSDFIYFFIAIVGMLLGLFVQRLVTFGLLLMLPLIGSAFNVKSDSIIANRSRVLQMIIIMSAIAGSLSLVLFTSPTIPAISKAFVPPFAALEYIDSHNLTGNVFNDPEFGDVLMWNSKKLPKLFVDTRFDMYSWKILQDYMTLAECKPGWHDLLARYKINWIFLSPVAPLCHHLEKNSAWKVMLKDEYAEIIVRRSTYDNLKPSF